MFTCPECKSNDTEDENYEFVSDGVEFTFTCNDCGTEFAVLCQPISVKIS